MNHDELMGGGPRELLRWTRELRAHVCAAGTAKVLSEAARCPGLANKWRLSRRHADSELFFASSRFVWQAA